jgi:hypothetical protein
MIKEILNHFWHPVRKSPSPDTASRDGMQKAIEKLDAITTTDISLAENEASGILAEFLISQGFEEFWGAYADCINRSAIFSLRATRKFDRYSVAKLEDGRTMFTVIADDNTAWGLINTGVDTGTGVQWEWNQLPPLPKHEGEWTTRWFESSDPKA